MAHDIRDLADEEVMQLVQRGDPRAFELLYDRHGGAAYSLAYRMTGRQAPAEDVGREEARSVRGALETLPKDQRNTIELAYFGGFSHSQIADMLNEPVGTVKGR